MENIQGRLASVEEVSRRLSISQFTTRRLIKSKQLRSVRVGNRVLIPETEVQRVLRQGCGKHTVKA
jgi:excisionase family DNA binding protein